VLPEHRRKLGLRLGPRVNHPKLAEQVLRAAQRAVNEGLVEHSGTRNLNGHRGPPNQQSRAGQRIWRWRAQNNRQAIRSGEIEAAPPG
jgi:hypothetical protein